MSTEQATTSQVFDEYIQMLEELDALGECSPKWDELADKMDGVWKRLTKADVAEVRRRNPTKPRAD